MPIRMKHWLALVGAGLLLVAAWTLPPEPLRVQTTSLSPEELLVRDLQREAVRVHGAIQRSRWADSLSALLVASAVDGLAVGVPPDPRFTSEGLAEARATFASALADLGPRSDVVVGLFIQRPDQATVPDAPDPSYSTRTETYVGSREGTEFCYELVLARARNLTDDFVRMHADHAPTGCRLYAKYGLAGPGVQGWMESGALEFGREDARPEQPPGVRMWPLEAPVFGLMGSPFSRSDFGADRCLAGRADACENLLTDAAAMGRGTDEQYFAANTPATFVERASRWSPFGAYDDYLLADLEREFGAEAFARFWTSQEPLEEAFEGAFGLSLGQWVASWTAEHIGVYEAGPGMWGSVWWGSMLALSMLATIAGGTAMLRRVA